MLENGKMSVHQFFVFVLVFTIGSSILVAPAGLVQNAKQDGWIAEILDMCIGLLLVWMYCALAEQYPNETLIEYSETILGKWFGKLVALLFILFFLVLSALLLREMGDFITTQIMPETPIQAIEILFLVIVIFGTRLGLEPITRAVEIFFPWILLLFSILVVSISPQVKLENLQPIFENGFKPILSAAFPGLGLPYAELVIFLMIFPYVNRSKTLTRVFLFGTLLGGVILIIVSLLTIMTIGVDLTAKQIYPSYVLAKKISIGKFLERIEAIMAGIWFLTMYFKLTLSFYSSALGLAQILKLRDYRFLTLPLGMLLLLFSIICSPNISYFNTFIANIWTPYCLTFGFLLPIVLLVVNGQKKYLSSKTNR